jgi:hypothetical protein
MQWCQKKDALIELFASPPPHSFDLKQLYWSPLQLRYAFIAPFLVPFAQHYEAGLFCSPRHSSSAQQSYLP